LRVFTPNDLGGEGPNQISDLDRDAAKMLNIQRLLSDKGLTPQIRMSGMMLPSKEYSTKYPFVYIVQDYIPRTLEQVHKDYKIGGVSGQKMESYIDNAIAVCYEIQSLGYFNLDCHGGNFMVDESKGIVYAIDFSDLTIIYKKGREFKGKIGGIKL